MNRALVTAIVVLLLVPVAAHAATYTVGAGQEYPTIADALAKAGDGDTVHVLPGAYVEDPLTIAHKVRIEGEPGTIVSNKSTDATKPLFTVTADGATLATMTLASTAGPVVAAQGAGVAIEDALIVSAVGPGPAVQLTDSGSSSLVRSSVAAVASGADAVDVQATGSNPVVLKIDSSILSGGAHATSLNARRSNTLPTGVGNVTVSAVHATLAGAATAIGADSSGVNVLTPAGAITVTADRSIIRGAQTHADCASCVNANTATIGVTQSDTSTADVFVNAPAKNFHLRADAAADIDHGGPAVSGESDRDIDGEPRVVGAASDLGADEFVNKAPVARLAAPAAVRTPGATTFDASASSDPETGAGGGIASYHFEFGDGTSQDSTSPTVTHAYTRPGTYAATVTVTDVQGLAGAASAPVQAQVVDGIAPTARIIAPRNGGRLRLRSVLRFTGSAADDTGVAAVGLTLQRLGTGKVTKIRVPIVQGIWTYKVPKKLGLRRGRYELDAYAVDGAGNVSQPARARFTLK